MATSEYESTLVTQRNKVIDFVKRCASESRSNEKEPRRPQNKLNWDYFHGNIDWSHKREEDPKIHLHKIGVAAERIRAKFKSALMKYEDWLIVERKYFPSEPLLPTFAAKNLLTKQLRYAKAKIHISDAILRGAIESRMALKIGGKYVTKPRFVKESGELVRKEQKIWQLDLNVLPFEGYHCDTNDSECPLYEIEECRVDFFRILALSADEQTSDKPFRKDAVSKLEAYRLTERDEAEKSAKGNYLESPGLRERKSILIQNFYGTILNDDGSILEWEAQDGTKLPLENVFCVIANEAELLIDPARNKRWSAQSPFIATDLLRSPNKGRKAVLDAGTNVNQADDELFSLMLAGAIKSAHNVTWYRKSAIADKKALSGGIRDGASIAIDDSLPPGAEPMGVVVTGKIPQEAFMMQASLDRTFAENVVGSNETDMGGTPSNKLATQIIKASSAIGEITDSMTADIEEEFIEPLAEECLYEIIQHIDDMDEEEVKSCFEDRQDLAEQFLKLSPKARFEQVAGTLRFRGKGLKGLIANQAKAQAMINLISTIMANPLTAQQVESTISVSKLIREAAKGFGLDIEELAPTEAEKQMIEQKQLIRENALAQAELMGQQTGQPGVANASQGSQPSPEQPASGGNPQGGM